MQTFAQFLEAKFQPSGMIKRINQKDLIQLIKSNAERLFGVENVTVSGPDWARYVEMNLGDRYFDMQVRDKFIASFGQSTPEIQAMTDDDMPAVYSIQLALQRGKRNTKLQRKQQLCC